MSFEAKNLGERLQKWGGKEWTKATPDQMHYKRKQRRGTKGKTRDLWWQDRKSGKVPWGQKSFYNAPWNKRGREDDPSPYKKAKPAVPEGSTEKVAPALAPTTIKVAPPVAPTVAPMELDPVGLGGSSGSGASRAEVNAADFAAAVARAMHQGMVLPIPVPMPVRVNILSPATRPPAVPIARPPLAIEAPGPVTAVEEVENEEGADGLDPDLLLVHPTAGTEGNDDPDTDDSGETVN